MTISSQHLTNGKPDLSLPHPGRILRWPEVQARVSICRSHAHQLIAQGKFPAPIKLSLRASGWLESEINAWIEQRIADSRTNNTDAA